MNATLYVFTQHVGPVYTSKHIDEVTPAGYFITRAHQHVYRAGVERYSDAQVIPFPTPLKVAA
jgi:hypothetical protein